MAVAGFGLAIAVGVTGCGAAKQLSAKDQVSKGFSSLNDASSATFTFSLDTTAADLAAISKAEGDPLTASDRKTLQQVINGDIVVAVDEPDGKTFGDQATSSTSTQDLSTLLSDPAALSAALKKQGAFSASVQLSGGSLVELRSLDGKLYAKADVKKILSLAGQDSSALDSELASLPPSMASLAKAAKGEWVSLDLVKAAQAAKSQGLLDSLPKQGTASSVDPAQVSKLVNDLKAAYQKNATIASIGSSDKGDGYRVSAPAKQVLQAVSPDLVSILGQSSAADVKKEIASVPDKKFNLDLYVKDDKLTNVSLDLTQFLDKPVTGKKLALNVGIDVDPAKISAPSGAAEIDVAQILGSLPTGLTSGASSSGAGSSSSLSSGTGLTKSQIQDLKNAGMTDAQIQQLEDAQK
jgi:hypothetical protein